MQKLAASSAVQQCFVRHSFRYWMGRNEEEQDACTMVDAYNAYDKAGGSLPEMLASLFTSKSFLLRNR
jgi:hypothetical protein